ncbi:MAG: holo-ACP synthase [Pseudomonadota bacterium]|nr:holo-ACP synthase [Pseudomonadota bacterium]
MIIGTGSDLIDIRRIEKTLERFGSRFIKRIFTDVEIQKSEERLNRSASYAKRFAAKEATSKALGTGFRKGVFWKDIGVVNKKTGKPSINLSGGAKKQLESIIPINYCANIQLTVTDDFPWAQAQVIIEAIRESEYSKINFRNEGNNFG